MKGVITLVIADILDQIFAVPPPMSIVTLVTLVLLPLAASETVSDSAWEHFDLVNQLRAEGYTCPEGRSYEANPTPLRFDCRLWKASKLHSEDMGAQNYFSHTSLDGRSPWDRAEAQGIRANGENIAAGRSSPSGVLDQWKNSDGHCKNMMNSNFKVFAVGYAYDSSSRYRHYWTQMFKSSDVSDLDTSCYPTTATTTTPITTTTTTAATTSTTSITTTTAVTTTTTLTATQSATQSTSTTKGTETSSSTATTATASSQGSTSQSSTVSTVTGTQTGTETMTGTSTTNTDPGATTTLTDTTSSATTPDSETSLVSEEPASTTGSQSTTTSLAVVEGKLLLEVSDPQQFLAASLEDSVKSFLAKMLDVSAERIRVGPNKTRVRFRQSLSLFFFGLSVTNFCSYALTRS